MNQKKITNLEVLKSIPPDDIRVIINGYLGSENADPAVELCQKIKYHIRDKEFTL